MPVPDLTPRVYPIGLLLLSFIESAYAEDISKRMDSPPAGREVVGGPAEGDDPDFSLNDIRIMFDGLDAEPRLNLSTDGMRTSYQSGEVVTFIVTSNYPDFISHAELRLVETDENGSRQIEQVRSVELNDHALWTMPPGGPGQFEYTLRVYDAIGRFDETIPLVLNRRENVELSDSIDRTNADYSVDRTAIRNIPVHGGSVTVTGSPGAVGDAVMILGQRVPVADDGGFVFQRIMPSGEHLVTVEVPRSNEESVFFQRSLTIPDSEWFYVGLADIVFGRRGGDDAIEGAAAGEFERVYKTGRLAFYLKGKVKGSYILTAALDTGEGNLSTLFHGLDEKDARSVLGRLDPDQYYPVYGDESTQTDDTPSDGKLYFRLESGDSYVLWGNYRAEIAPSTFLSTTKTLYGGAARYRSNQVTPLGERRADVSFYAAQPGRLTQREELRATGGSSFILKRRDITIRSATVMVEFRDIVTGMVRRRLTMSEGEDYELDEGQGILTLRRPLASSSASSGPVRFAANDGDEVWLVVSYEFTPVVTDLEGYSYGVRAEHWLNDHFRIGAAGLTEKTGGANQQAVGADIRLSGTRNTWLEAEIAGSRGPGAVAAQSTDGGLTSSEELPAGRRDLAAHAWRLRTEGDLSELTGGRLRGRVAGYYEDRGRGFQTFAYNSLEDESLWGLHTNVDVTKGVNIGGTYDRRQQDASAKVEEASGSINVHVPGGVKVAIGAGWTRRMMPDDRRGEGNGERLIAGLRVDRTVSADLSVHAFGQGTLRRRGKLHSGDRGGVGVTWRLSDKLVPSGEVSFGEGGWGALASMDYEPDSESHYYLGYRLDPESGFADTEALRRGSDSGGMVVGARRNLSEELSVFTENNLDMFGQNRSLGQTYGVVYRPTPSVTLTGGLESGRVRDNRMVDGVKAADFDRLALSTGATYRNDDSGFRARMRAELRRERSSDGSRDADTHAGGIQLGWTPDEVLTLEARADVLFSEARGAVSSLRDGEYAETSFSAAYRPVDNDRLNFLIRNTFLHDLPGEAQVNVAGDPGGPGQRSHIFSADGNFDLSPWLTIGGKYGMRLGRSFDGRTGEWSDAEAHLGIVRADVHIVRKWDLLGELRMLAQPSSESADLGFLAMASRHLGDNFKLGIGYNFGRFTDDLRDLTLNDEGIFINAVGKF